ncbi:MAG: response regulator transcription factor [Acidobacteriota bacterium]
MSEAVLMIDDDAELAAMVAEYLGEAGFVVDTCLGAREGLERLASGDYQAVLLDLMMPELDGWETCRLIRESSDVPILMLTARGEASDRIVGLELGADDYLAKPFDPRELLARLRAVLRRTQRGPTGGEVGVPILRFGRLEIDRDARVVRLDGEERVLTGQQFDLVVHLAENAGRVLSREQLAESVKGEPHLPFERSIDVQVSRIRAVLEDDPKKPRRLLTVRGAGYVFARKQDADD